MWNAVVSDLVACGYEVTSVVDPQVRQRMEMNCQLLPEHKVVLTDYEVALSLEENWSDASVDANRVVVIAPEIDGILVNTIKYLRSRKHVVVAPSLHFLRVASDKWLTAQALGEHIQQPKTWLASEIDEHNNIVDQPALEFVLKPRDGCGGGGCKRIENWEQLRETIHSLDNPEQWIVQKWCIGKHCSVAMLVDEYGTCRVLGATEQLLRYDETGFQYFGARGPLAKQDLEGMENWCQQVLALIPGALGWVGVDYIDTENGPIFCHETAPVEVVRSEMYCSTRTLIEINPRLTTSYLLYRQVYGPKLVEGVIGLELDDETMQGAESVDVFEYLVNTVT